MLVDSKNSILIPEQRKNRVNHLLKIRIRKNNKRFRAQGKNLGGKYELLIWYSVLSLSFSFAQSFFFCSRYRSSRHHVTLSELLKICQKLQYGEKSSSKQIKNKHSATENARKIKPRLCSGELTWAVPAIQSKTSIWSAVNFKKQLTSVNSKLEPAIWSRDTGQRMPCFVRCLLIKSWMSAIKDVCCKLA